jgi:hypothetical protein
MAKPERQGSSMRTDRAYSLSGFLLLFTGSTVFLVLPGNSGFQRSPPFFVSGSLRGFNRSDTVMRQAASPDSKLISNRIMVSIMRKKSRSMQKNEKT